MPSRGRKHTAMARKLSLSEPEMTIFLKTGSTTTYSTHDKIEGTLSITAWQTMSFEHVSVQFRGEYTNLVRS